MQAVKRIIINTGAQYIRAILNIVFSFIATRIILEVLGVNDYGIYTLIAGVVSILSFVTNSLIITTQRYLSVAQGLVNIIKSKIIFNNSLILHLLIGVSVVALLELLFPLFFNGFLNIPEARIGAAKTLYHIVSLILFLTFITSPFRAVLISHENIVYISLIESIDSIFKLLIAYSLYYINFDKLIVYGVLLLSIQAFNFITLSVFCFYKYNECTFPNFRLIDKKYLKELFLFAGWTMYNLICNLGRTQGISILLNRYMGPAINTAYGLGFQISGALGNLSQSLLNAINPQLMKAEGAGERKKMLRFAEIESKFAFFLLSALTVPCIFEMPRLLELWLGEVPSYSTLFCRMVLLAHLADTITAGLGSANQAEGSIRNYTLTICSIKLATLPIVALILYLKINIIYVAVAYIFIELITSMMRIPFLRRTAQLDIQSFISNVISKEFIPTLTIILTSAFITTHLTDSYRFLLTFSIGISCYCLSILFFGLCKDEKEIITKILKRIKYEK